MKQFSLLALTTLLILYCARIFSQQDFSNSEIRSTRVRGNIYMLNGTGGNVGVSVGSDGILIIDDKFAPLAEKIRAALKRIDGGQLKFILNTHFHGDHTGGNEAFGSEATIIAHRNVRKRLMTPRTRQGRTSPASPEEAWPVITFDTSLSVHFNGEEIKAIHFPRGHTDGDTILFFSKSNVVHMGDDFFAGRFPFVDLASGGDVEGLTDNIGKVIQRLTPDVKIIPGHGPISTLQDLKAYQDMLVKTQAIVRQRMDSNKTLKQIQTEGLPKEWETWGGGFISSDRWIETIYRSLSR